MLGILGRLQVALAAPARSGKSVWHYGSLQNGLADLVWTEEDLTREFLERNNAIGLLHL